MPWLTNTTLPQNLLYICRHAVHEPCSAWTRSACSFRSVWSSSRSEPLRQLGASLLWWMIHCKGNEWPLLRMGLLVFCPWALHFLEFWLDLDSTHLFFTSMETGIVYAWVYRKLILLVQVPLVIYGFLPLTVSNCCDSGIVQISSVMFHSCFIQQQLSQAGNKNCRLKILSPECLIYIQFGVSRHAQLSSIFLDGFPWTKSSSYWKSAILRTPAVWDALPLVLSTQPGIALRKPPAAARESVPAGQHIR